MPSKQHEQWKHDLFDHLDQKLSGCVSCESGETRESHTPTFRGQFREASQRILWTCGQMHPHSYDVLKGAGSVVMEKYQSAPESGRCCPDLTILNTHREPIAFIEVVRYNRPKKSVAVAEELDIPLFTILAPHRRSLNPGLHRSRPWWEFDPTLSEAERSQMHFMEKVGDELMRRNNNGDSTWSELDMAVDEDGNLEFASLRGSPPNLTGPTFPRAGDLIVAELCSWDCDKAMEMQRRQWKMDAEEAAIYTKGTLERDLGQILLGALSNATDKTARIVVPIGTQEVHVEMSVHPLNPHVSPSDSDYPEFEESVIQRC